MNKILFVLMFLIFSNLCFSQKGEEQFNIGLANYIEGKFEDAISNLESTIRTNPEYPEAYLYLGLSKANTGNYDDALLDLDLAIYINSNDGKAYFFRGLIRYEYGRQAGYCTDLYQALELGVYELKIFDLVNL